MKLTAAKCPNCNADIEVNENLNKAICQYCGSTILIESAIQKHQMEITGTIKVDGIQTYSEKIDIIQKHLKIGNIEEATEILEELLEKNPFDEQALLIYIQLKTAILNSANQDIKEFSIIPKVKYLEELIEENNADEYVYKLKKTTNGNYEDIINEYVEAIETSHNNLNKEKIKSIFISIIISGFLFYLIYTIMGI